MCRKLIYLVSFLLVFGLSRTLAQGQENQIINGEFDDGLESWGIYTYQNTTEGFTVEVVESAGISGRNAAMVSLWKWWKVLVYPEETPQCSTLPTLPHLPV